MTSRNEMKAFDITDDIFISIEKDEFFHLSVTPNCIILMIALHPFLHFYRLINVRYTSTAFAIVGKPNVCTHVALEYY